MLGGSPEGKPGPATRSPSEVRGVRADPGIQPVSPILLAREVACAAFFARTSTNPTTRVATALACSEF
jgi:hypothetical protein